MTWEAQREAWKKVPVDHIGYCSAAQMLVMPDEELRTLSKAMAACRYSSWRNEEGLWRTYMGLDVSHGRVLDYGCGTGIEALEYAKSGSSVSVADVNETSVALAIRILALHGFIAAGYIIDDAQSLENAAGGRYDLVVMNGVLHHIERPELAVSEAYRLLRTGGELRVMVYTDRNWTAATGTEPPLDVSDHPKRMDYVRWNDEVGEWSDWYNGERLEARFGEWFVLREWHYIGKGAPEWNTPFGRYGIGILEKR